GVDERVGYGIGIGVAAQSLGMGDLDPPEDELAPFSERVGVVADADAHEEGIITGLRHARVEPRSWFFAPRAACHPERRRREGPALQFSAANPAIEGYET